LNPNFERALLLYQQSRYEMAEAELRQALALEPGDAYAHSLLALCLAEREQFQDATGEAEQAIHLEPDFPFAHYAHARVLYSRNRLPEALTAIEEAIRLDSVDADYFSLLAGIHLQECRWQKALEAAELGLQFEPEHVACTNQRAIAMVKVGRKAEAGATIDAALAKNPENALTHANQGWTYLEKGKPKEALHHFREALRIDPTNEWARQGIVEALKARNFIYALMLRYFLWMSRFSSRGQWGIVLGAYFGNRILGAVASSNPNLAPFILPIRILYVCFALMTWMASPFFNLLLRMNRFGRLALSHEQTVASNWFGLCLLCAVLALAGCIIQDFKGASFVAMIVFGLLLLPVSAVFRCESGWPRNVMAGIAILLALLGLGALGLLITAGPDSSRDIFAATKGLFSVFLIGTFLSTWGANFLTTGRRRR